MKCWKCGNELAEGVNKCQYCGVSQNRTSTPTEIGRAMRILYDRYGAKEVLSNSAYLVNGLGDLTEDSKKLRSQLKIALDAGIGRTYLEQLSTGKPDAAFDTKVKRLLTEDAGLSDRIAAEIAGYFDEMIGWPRPTAPLFPQNTPAQPIPPQHIPVQPIAPQHIPVQPIASRPIAEHGIPRTPGADEIDRSGRTAAYPAGTAPVIPQTLKKKSKPYAYEIALIICTVLVSLLGVFANPNNNPELYTDYMANIPLLVPLFMSFLLKKENLRDKASGLSITLMIVVFLLILAFCGDGITRIRRVDMLSLKTDTESVEMYLWHRHLLIGDIITIAGYLLMWLQMLRHRLLEKKKHKQQVTFP